VQVACQVVRERDFRLVAEATLDLSTTGMLVPTREAVLTGEDVLVSFRVPGTAAWVDCEAVVARVVHGRRAADAFTHGRRPRVGRALGLAFESLSLWDQLLLHTELAALGRGRHAAIPRAAT
jgi:hypothetical protein